MITPAAQFGRVRPPVSGLVRALDGRPQRDDLSLGGNQVCLIGFVAQHMSAAEIEQLQKSRQLPGRTPQDQCVEAHLEQCLLLIAGSRRLTCFVVDNSHVASLIAVEAIDESAHDETAFECGLNVEFAVCRIEPGGVLEGEVHLDQRDSRVEPLRRILCGGEKRRGKVSLRRAHNGPCARQHGGGSLDGAVGGRQVEEILKHLVNHRAAHSVTTWLLGNPIDHPEAVKQRTVHEVARTRGRERGNRELGFTGDLASADGHNGVRIRGGIDMCHDWTLCGGTDTGRLLRRAPRRAILRRIVLVAMTSTDPNPATPSPARRPGLSFRVGTVPVSMPWSGLIGVGAIAFLWSDRFAIDPGQPLLTMLLAGVFALLFYASVLGHEMGHAWVARAVGFPVHEITLWVLGGYTSYERRDESALREGFVAAAGPGMSLVIGLACLELSSSPVSSDVRVYVVLHALAVSNIALGIYNLLPGLPLDGGAVLKSFIWGVLRDERRATVIAAWSGRVVAVAVFVIPVYLTWKSYGSLDMGSVVFSGLISAYIYAGASDALHRAGFNARVPGLSARSLLRPAVLVLRETPLSEAIRLRDLGGASAIVVVDGAGRPAAICQEAAVDAVPVERRPWVPVSSVAAATEPRSVLAAELTGAELLRAIASIDSSEFLVVETDGGVAGVLTVRDVERALAHD